VEWRGALFDERFGPGASLFFCGRLSSSDTDSDSDTIWCLLDAPFGFWPGANLFLGFFPRRFRAFFGGGASLSSPLLLSRELSELGSSSSLSSLSSLSSPLSSSELLVLVVPSSMRFSVNL